MITWTNISDKVYISRLSLSPSDTRIPFKFQCRQFPIFVCFAMTINKIWHIPSITNLLAWSTLCSNIKSYLKKWSEDFATRWRWWLYWQYYKCNVSRNFSQSVVTKHYMYYWNWCYKFWSTLFKIYDISLSCITTPTIEYDPCVSTGEESS